jgi:hypothetical protein
MVFLGEWQAFSHAFKVSDAQEMKKAGDYANVDNCAASGALCPKRYYKDSPLLLLGRGFQENMNLRVSKKTSFFDPNLFDDSLKLKRTPKYEFAVRRIASVDVQQCEVLSKEARGQMQVGRAKVAVIVAAKKLVDLFYDSHEFSFSCP